MLSVSCRTQKISLLIRKYFSGKSRSINERAIARVVERKLCTELGSENPKCTTQLADPDVLGR